MDLDATVLAATMSVWGEEGLGKPSVTYSPASGSPFTLPQAVFEKAYTRVEFADGTPVSTTRPALGVRLSLFPSGVSPAQGDQVTVRGEVYNVFDVRPDGEGHALLILMAAS